jgi:hypothetical protein
VDGGDARNGKGEGAGVGGSEEDFGAVVAHGSREKPLPEEETS